KANAAAFLAGSVEEIREQLRLDLGAPDNVAVIEQLDAADSAAREVDVQGVFALEIRIAKRMNLDDVALDAVPAGGAVNFRFIVAIVLQLADELRRREHFAIENAVRRAINASAGLIHMPRETLIDHAPVSEPVVGEEAGADQHQAKEGAHERQAHAGEQKIAIDSQSHDVSRSYPRTKFLELPEAPYSLHASEMDGAGMPPYFPGLGGNAG